jgi:hypothetical protein
MSFGIWGHLLNLSFHYCVLFEFGTWGHLLNLSYEGFKSVIWYLRVIC